MGVTLQCYVLKIRVAWTGKKRLRSQDDYCTGNDQQCYAAECIKKPRTSGDVEEVCFLSVVILLIHYLASFTCFFKD